MLWNELSYEEQLKILSLIEDTLLKQVDELMQDGLVAAIVELEAWSNCPCENIPLDPFVIQKKIDDIDSEWDKIASF